MSDDTTEAYIGGFSKYRAAIGVLPDGELTRQQLLTDEFLIGREGKLRVFYAPLEHVENNAKVVFVGVTPGWQQMRLAFEACRDALVDNRSDPECLTAAKVTAAFAGMRPRIVAWLDDLGAASWLGLESTASLFEVRGDLLHTTSAIRYPVFVGDEFRNYTGHSPSPDRSPLLMSIVTAKLMPELAATPGALIVPMGTAVSALLASTPDVDPARCLFGFPHPSGANGHAVRQFAERRDALRVKVSSLPP